MQVITDSTDSIDLFIYNVPVFAMPSRPTGTGNLSLDDYLKNGRLETKVTPDSNILKIIRQNSKPLAIKGRNVEEAEDKEITSLFD